MDENNKRTIFEVIRSNACPHIESVPEFLVLRYIHLFRLLVEYDVVEEGLVQGLTSCARL